MLRLAQAPDLPAPTLLAYLSTRRRACRSESRAPGQPSPTCGVYGNYLGEMMTEVIEASDLKYDARGLIPCVVQQYDTGEVLMVAWMNEESVGLTLKTGTTWFGAAAARSSGTRARRAATCRRSRSSGSTAIAIRCWSRSTRRVRPAIPATVPASLKTRVGRALD